MQRDSGVPIHVNLGAGLAKTTGNMENRVKKGSQNGIVSVTDRVDAVASAASDMSTDGGAVSDTFALIAKKFRWISQIQAPDAPGFVFCGGEVNASDFEHHDSGIVSASLSGKGLTQGEAFNSCVGEGIEHLSRLEWGTEEIVHGDAGSVSHGLDEEALENLQLLLAGQGGQGESLDWMPAKRLSDQADVLVPVGICLRRANNGITQALPFAISTGCAAGPTHDAAVLSALLEVVERDAVSMWWVGGRQGAQVSLETVELSGSGDMISHLRQGKTERHTWLLDITTKFDIPCAVAMSLNTNGKGFACGVAARPHMKAAVRAALLELCQMELGHHLVDAKRKARGEDFLNESDRRSILRSEHFEAVDCAILYPGRGPRETAGSAEADTNEAIDEVLRRLSPAGFTPLIVDLTREFLGVPVVRAVIPGLQHFPSSIETARLRNAAASERASSTPLPEVPLF